MFMVKLESHNGSKLCLNTWKFTLPTVATGDTKVGRIVMKLGSCYNSPGGRITKAWTRVISSRDYEKGGSMRQILWRMNRKHLATDWL